MPTNRNDDPFTGIWQIMTLIILTAVVVTITPWLLQPPAVKGMSDQKMVELAQADRALGPAFGLTATDVKADETTACRIITQTVEALKKDLADRASEERAALKHSSEIGAAVSPWYRQSYQAAVLRLQKSKQAANDYTNCDPN